MGDWAQHHSGARDDSKPARHDLWVPIKHDTHRHQNCKTSLAGEGHDPQQADLLQVQLCLHPHKQPLSVLTF